MKMTITESMFKDQFTCMGRGDQFSHEALSLIFNYYEEMDENFELDVIGICCDVSELSYEEAVSQYSIDYDPEWDDIEEVVTDYLNDNTSVIGTTLNDTIVFLCF